MTNHTINWLPDHLGDEFEMTVVEHPHDYSGSVTSTVIRRKCEKRDKGILYIHGFSDYFFQKEMADVFTAKGYSFYAVDLRKYGRSLQPDQKMFQVRDLREYFQDIDSAIDIMKNDGISHIILLGHSTGGLTASLYMASDPPPFVRALVLNSPFLEWNISWIARKIGIPFISSIGKIWPNLKIRQPKDSGYAETLSDRHSGEWAYRTGWKPDILPDPDAGWVRAINKAQKSLRKARIHVPVLLLHSAESVRKGDEKEKYFHADAILDVRSISYYGRRLGDSVTEVEIKGGLHDLALSSEKIRAEYYRIIIEWLSTIDIADNRHGRSH